MNGAEHAPHNPMVSGSAVTREHATVTHEHRYPRFIVVAACAVTLWVGVQLTFQFWAFAQQTLVAQSQAAQQIQQAQKQAQDALRTLEAERAKAAARPADTARP